MDVGNRQEPLSLPNPFPFLFEIKTAKSHTPYPAGKRDEQGVLAIYNKGCSNRGPRAAQVPVQTLRGGGRSVAQGDGLHVQEADVHLGLDVDALPDLEHGRSSMSGHPRPPRPPATPCPPTSATHQDAPQVRSRAKCGTSSICLFAG